MIWLQEKASKQFVVLFNQYLGYNFLCFLIWKLVVVQVLNLLRMHALYGVYWDHFSLDMEYVEIILLK